MSHEDSGELDVEERVSVSTLTSHVLSPSFDRHLGAFSPLSAKRASGARHCYFTPEEAQNPQRRTAPKTPESPHSAAHSEAAAAFSDDFDRHCARLQQPADSGLCFAQLAELMTDLHLLNQSSASQRTLLAEFWNVLALPGATRIPAEDVKKALKSVLGIVQETSPIWASVLRSFQTFATNRLRYLTLQAYAIAPLHTGASKPRFSMGCKSESPQNKENSFSPSKPSVRKPQLPLGRNPSDLLKTKTGLSPLRIPELRRPLATVKVNLTPQKYDIINVYRGDSIKELTMKFADKHCLSAEASARLQDLLETRLQTRTNSLD